MFKGEMVIWSALFGQLGKCKLSKQIYNSQILAHRNIFFTGGNARTC